MTMTMNGGSNNNNKSTAVKRRKQSSQSSSNANHNKNHTQSKQRRPRSGRINNNNSNKHNNDDENDDDSAALDQAYADAIKSKKRWYEFYNHQQKQHWVCQGTMLFLGTVIVVLAIAINRYNSNNFVVVVDHPPSSSPTTTTTTRPSTQNVQDKSSTKQKPTQSSASSSINDERVVVDDDGRPIASMSSSWELLGTYQHDHQAFTQGLEVHYQYHNNDNHDNDDSSSSVLQVIESTGHYGYDGRRGTFDESSTVRIWDVHNGTILHQIQLQDQYFAEGLTKITVPTRSKSITSSTDNANTNDQEYYLLITWRERTALLLDPTTLETVHTFRYDTHTHQGWGVAFDPIQQLIYVSDGSHTIHVWDVYFDEDDDKNDDSSHNSNEDPKDEKERIERNNAMGVIRQSEVRRFSVSLKLRIPGRQDLLDRPELNLINELEWDNSTSTILANLWYENVVLRIDPTTGHVVKIYDFNKLYPKEDRLSTADCLNGIAMIHSRIDDNDGTTKHYQDWLLTGKYWPYIYKVRVEV